MNKTFEKPKAGLTVTVTTEWVDYLRPWSFNVRRTNVYSGVVVESAKYDDPQSFRMATGEIGYPVRIISLDRVSVLNFSDGSTAKHVANKKIEVSLWEVKSDSKKGGTYIVTREGNHFSCTCAGFSFRKTCKHSLSIKSKVI